ncbi:hypothetical protein KBA63_02115 [Candidatus Woesebacteria bacterium]|nr:hypothetical protein [Candidatus Woesebacteria bacterium]
METANTVVYSPKVSPHDLPIAKQIIKHVMRVVDNDLGDHVRVPVSTFESSSQSPATVKKFVLQTLGETYSITLENPYYIFSKVKQ